MPGENPTGALHGLPAVPASCLSDGHTRADHFSPHLLLSSYLLPGPWEQPPLWSAHLCPHTQPDGASDPRGSELICSSISLGVKAESPSEPTRPHRIWRHQPPDHGAQHSPFHTLCSSHAPTSEPSQLLIPLPSLRSLPFLGRMEPRGKAWRRWKPAMSCVNSGQLVGLPVPPSPCIRTATIN